MSALWAPTGSAGHAPAPDSSTPDSSSRASMGRPVLWGLPAPKPRLARIPFLLVLIALFGLGMTGLLMLNTTLQSQAFEVSNLSRQDSELTYTQGDLDSKLYQLAAPQELARRASAYGMRPNPYPAFLVLPKGRVLGRPRRVTGNEVPVLVVKTPAELAAERAATAARAKALADQRAAEARVRAERAAAAKAAAASLPPLAPPRQTTRPAQTKTPQTTTPAQTTTPKPSGGRG